MFDIALVWPRIPESPWHYYRDMTLELISGCQCHWPLSLTTGPEVNKTYETFVAHVIRTSLYLLGQVNLENHMHRWLMTTGHCGGCTAIETMPACPDGLCAMMGKSPWWYLRRPWYLSLPAESSLKIINNMQKNEYSLPYGTVEWT